MIKLVVDCFGGDRSPKANVEGAIKALNEIKDLYLILTGDENILTEVESIEKELNELQKECSNINLFNELDMPIPDRRAQSYYIYSKSQNKFSTKII